LIETKRPKPAGDRALWVGARAHFDDAAYYTKTYAGRTEDVAFYAKLAKARGGKVLEYGAGNGRIALPMARAGCEVVGVDWSRPMLDDFERQLIAEKPAVQGRIRLVEGDMREVELNERFDLVLCTFNTFLHLYTRPDIEAFFEKVRGHLAPGGQFVCDISLPQPGDLARDPNRAYSAPRFRYPTTGQMVRYAERFDYDAARQILFVTMEFSPINGDEPWVVPLAHRQFFPQEIEAHFHYNGLEVVEVKGGFENETLDRFSDSSVWVARLREPPTPAKPKAAPKAVKTKAAPKAPKAVKTKAAPKAR
jgi:SAM-dependent methyltransferase